MEAIARPLYLQVREALIHRIAEGEWAAGEALPSEFALAEQIGVSQGTVRKALDALAAENLVERQQGRGTFIPEHTEARALYHFFRMQDAAGAPLVPTTVSQAISRHRAPVAISRTLGVTTSSLWRIMRVRAIDGRPAIVEHIYLDPALFPALNQKTMLPNALYSYYQREAGISVARAEDRLSAAAADEPLAQHLGISVGAPLLLSRRQAFDLRGRVIEIRESWFDTTAQDYAVSLR